jgi:hypothetical protein
MPKKTYTRKKLADTLLSVDVMPQIPVSVDPLFPHFVVSRPKAARKTLRSRLLPKSVPGKLCRYRTLASSYFFLSRSTKKILLTSFRAMRMMALLGFLPRLISLV